MNRKCKTCAYYQEKDVCELNCENGEYYYKVDKCEHCLKTSNCGGECSGAFFESLEPLPVTDQKQDFKRRVLAGNHWTNIKKASVERFLDFLEYEREHFDVPFSSRIRRQTWLEEGFSESSFLE